MSLKLKTTKGSKKGWGRQLIYAAFANLVFAICCVENVTNVAKQTKILNMIGEFSWREYINPSYLPPSCVVKLPLKQSFYVMHAYQICHAIRRTFLTAMQIPVFWRKNRFRKIFYEFQFRIHILQILKNKEQQKKGSYHVHFNDCDTDFSIFFCLSNYIHFSLTNSRGSRVAGPKSRSRVQCRGRGKWFGVRGNSWVKTADMNTI